MQKAFVSLISVVILIGLLLPSISCNETIYTMVAPTPTPTPTSDGTSESEMESDLHTVKTAVDAFMLQSLKWPTENGMAPQEGEYALIEFNASFNSGGTKMGVENLSNAN